MTRTLRLLVAMTTATAVLVTPLAATAEQGRGQRDGLQHRLDQVVAAGAVGAVAEVRDGRRVWRGVSGTGELGTSRPVPVRGRFRVGSITKTFLATVVLQLVDRGRLRLDDPVERWLPGVVPDARITVRRLLDHTSGLYDVVRTLPMPPSQEFLDNRWRTWTVTELVDRALEHPPAFEPPGSAFGYSNTGYLLLAQIVEEATGRSYADLIERRIVEPLRLRRTSLPGVTPEIRGPHAYGYVPAPPDGAELLDYTEMNPSVFGPAGEMISTTRDLNRFLAALLSGRLVRPDLLEEMKTPGVEGGRYGLGLAWRETECGVRVYGNDGDALAYETWSFSTEDRRAQATVSITPDHQGDPDDAIDAFLDHAFCG